MSATPLDFWNEVGGINSPLPQHCNELNFWNYSTITIVPSFLEFYTFGSSTIVLSPLFGDHQLDHNRDESNQHNDTFSNLTFEFVFVF